jgi:cell division protein FtsI/penicillin-binding protein 2
VGVWKLNGKTFRNYDGRARGPNTPVQQILSQSLNTGAAYVALKMGRDTFKDYFLNKYQLGQETGIDLPGEAHGLMSGFNSNRDIETATASFGQGFAVTPINTIVALASLGNGGYLVTPHVMSEIVYNNGTTRKIVPPTPVPILKPGTSEKISRMLVTVVDKALFGGKAKLADYTVASKSGTAQIASHDGKGYAPGKYLHTFFAYAPAYDPRFIIFLFNKEPQNVDYASQTLGQPAMDLVKFLLNYYNVTPDRSDGIEKPLFPKQHVPAAPMIVPETPSSTLVTSSRTTT